MKTDNYPNSKEDFIELLMVLVFTKAKEDSRKTQKQHFAQYLNEEMGIPIDERSFIRHYDGYILGKEKYKTIPRNYNLDALSRYVGSDNFEDFMTLKEKDLEKGVLLLGRVKGEQKMRENKRICMIVTLILLIMLGLFISKYYKKNCMLWVDDHFEKIRCSGLDLEEKLVEERLAYFGKVEVCKDSIFFKNGEPIKFYLRYGGGIEFFTYSGEHPVYEGKFLAPVTPTIINSWVKACDSIQ